MNTILVNNKDLINELNRQAMTYMPALALDTEINLLSNTYYSSVMSILHFGEGELNFRKGERFTALGLPASLVTYFNDELTAWNQRGISSLDNAIEMINTFINSGILRRDPVSSNDFRDMRLRISEMLAEMPLKATDVTKLINGFDEVVSKATVDGEFGVVTFMRDKLVELRSARLSPTRGTEDNIPVWKLIGIIVMFGFPVYKSLRCLLAHKCCNTVSGLEGLIQFIGTVAAFLCH